MSVYPKRIISGDQVFIHVRVQSRLPGRPLMRVILEEPDGADTLVCEFWPAIFPQIRNEIGPVEHGELLRVEPVYLTARHLSGSSGDMDSMLNSIGKISTSTHFHFAHKIPEHYPPGRYRIRLEMRMNGLTRGSDTAADAFFFVDMLKLLDVIQEDRSSKAIIENVAAHPVPARIIGIGAREMRSSRVILQPGINQVRFKGSRGYLSYCEGRHTLALDREKSPFCVRNEEFSWREDTASGVIFILIGTEKGMGRLLSGRASKIWRNASGLMRRDEIRTNDNCDIYDEMLRERLLLELDGNSG